MDSADSVAQAAAAAGAAVDGGGSGSRTSAAAQLQSVRSDSAVQEAAQLQQRMHRVIAAVGFRPEQRAAFLQVETLPIQPACSAFMSWRPT
jgi:type II secretory pathway component PulJ